MLRDSFLLVAALKPQLIEGHGAGRRHVQAVHPVGHRDHYRVVAPGDGAVRQPVALGAKHHRQLFRL